MYRQNAIGVVTACNPHNGHAIVRLVEGGDLVAIATERDIDLGDNLSGDFSGYGRVVLRNITRQSQCNASIQSVACGLGWAEYFVRE